MLTLEKNAERMGFSIAQFGVTAGAIIPKTPVEKSPAL
jgi:hypothetical protein